MRVIVLMLALMLGAPSAFAQQRDGRGAMPPGKNQGMSRDQRERMRNDMQDVYRDRRSPGSGQERPQQRQLSPQEREQLRRDIDNANRNLKR